MEDICKPTFESFITDQISGSIDCVSVILTFKYEQQHLPNDKQVIDTMKERLFFKRLKWFIVIWVCRLEHARDNMGDESCVQVLILCWRFRQGFEIASELFLDPIHRPRLKWDLCTGEADQYTLVPVVFMPGSHVSYSTDIWMSFEEVVFSTRPLLMQFAQSRLHSVGMPLISRSFLKTCLLWVVCCFFWLGIRIWRAYHDSSLI